MAELCCFSVPLVPDDPRILKFFETAEVNFPGDRLVYVERSWKWVGPVENRVELVNGWLPEQRGNNRMRPIGNGTYGRRQIVASIYNHLAGPGVPDQVSEYRLVVGDDSELPECLPQLLKSVAPALDADFGWVDSRKCLNQLMRTPEDLQRNPEFSTISDYKTYPLRRKDILGRLKSGSAMRIRLSWINYWSDATAAALSFPDSEDEEMFHGLYERIADKGWILRLTDAPLDLDIPNHLEAAQRALNRFGNCQ